MALRGIITWGYDLINIISEAYPPLTYRKTTSNYQFDVSNEC